MLDIHNDWRNKLAGEENKEYYKKLKQTLIEEYSNYKVYPRKDLVFNAFNLTSFSSTKVVILGQDPYHGEGQAHGLSFSVQPGIKTPPSLKNIYKELQMDVSFTIPNHGFLNHWAYEGVLLLNTVLTVRKGEPNSHKGIGWEKFTDKAIQLLNKRQRPVVFILWGKNAQLKKKLITNDNHLVLESVHPSPLSAHRGFFKSSHFSKCNRFLKSTNQQPINWQLTINI
ncbi:uracil-DNA glycosylase [Proteinivorax hydrogeniformans]|uniref:Uracil-DNA glycosylase n=1 Tax=Proteinivorax hydrogeniformans TaxID=1826727 RepID=A0AAU8HST2_9FIRM